MATINRLDPCKHGLSGFAECEFCAEERALQDEVARKNIQLDSAARYNTTLEKCVARRCIEIAEPRDRHVGMMLRKEFNLPKAD